MMLEVRTLSSWEDIHAYAKPAWLYRGQCFAAWQLKTSLERCFEREGVVSPDERQRVEAELLREFSRAYHQFALHIPSENSMIEWYSLMQHHGAPTRLLDFSYSIYVAAYFALEVADADTAVWAVNGPWALQESVSALEREGKSDASKLNAPTQKSHETISQSLLFKPPFVKCAVPLTPFRLNERLRIQKGTFLVTGDVTETFMTNLTSLPGHSQAGNIVKLILPLRLRAQGIEQLHYMNISRTSLFPGLDGYAQSLGVYHPLFRPPAW